MQTATFQELKNSIPKEPGIYKYYDINNQLIYVGKAKNLLNRISSYFIKNNQSRKTLELVLRIHKIEFTIVNSEQDALILENELIKAYQPKYNIQLKDDKTFPYIVIKKENFPRVFLTRQKFKNGDEYIGPFASIQTVRTLMDHIKENIPIRTCNLPLTEKNIVAKKFKVCLEYHIGNCKGPCVGYQNIQDYGEGIKQIKFILKGNIHAVIVYLKKQLQEYVDKWLFEQAHIIQKKINSLSNYQASSIIVTNYQHHVDIIAIAFEDTQAFVSYIMMYKGAVVQTHIIPLEIPIEQELKDVLHFAIQHINNTLQSDASEIIVPIEIENVYKVKITVPKLGDKKKLLELAQKNADYALKEYIHKRKIFPKQTNDTMEVLQGIQEKLKLPNLPIHIECFDNSNFQGSSPVGAMVCFKNGVPFKSQYRKFHIQSVNGINDFASMKEIVLRRYKQVINQQLPLPNLIIIDGGKGQLNAAIESLQFLGVYDKVVVIGLAKRVEEIFFPTDTNPILLNWGSAELNLITNIRDEVHRFGITFHRKKRSSNMFK